MSRIICEVTGRSWSSEKIMDLKKCVRCGRLIDVRHESWADGPLCDVRSCPARSAKIVAAVLVEEKPRIKAMASFDWPKDVEHAEALERIRREHETQSKSESDGSCAAG